MPPDFIKETGLESFKYALLVNPIFFENANNTSETPLFQGTKAGHYLLKLLVPPTVAGSIIGRAGAQIKELQTTYDVSQA